MSFNLILDLAVDKHNWLLAEMNHYKIKEVYRQYKGQPSFALIAFPRLKFKRLIIFFRSEYLNYV